LYSYLKRSTEDVPSDLIMKIASDIASGMNIMNSAGIVHRDLKSLVFLFFFFSF